MNHTEHELLKYGITIAQDDTTNLVNLNAHYLQESYRINSMTIPQIRADLKKYGLVMGGNKGDVAKRLIDYHRLCRKPIDDPLMSKMNNILVFDTETSGLPAKNNSLPTNLLNYVGARLIQIGYTVYTPDGAIILQNEILIKPDDFIIENEHIHGITNEKCARGLSIPKMFDIFSLALSQCGVLVAHNIEFDMGIILSECYRYYLYDVIRLIQSKARLCTMAIGVAKFKPILFGKPARTISLFNLHEALFKTPFKNCHTALADANACARCYFYMIKRRDIEKCPLPIAHEDSAKDEVSDEVEDKAKDGDKADDEVDGRVEEGSEAEGGSEDGGEDRGEVERGSGDECETEGEGDAADECEGICIHPIDTVRHGPASIFECINSDYDPMYVLDFPWLFEQPDEPVELQDSGCWSLLYPLKKMNEMWSTLRTLFNDQRLPGVTHMKCSTGTRPAAGIIMLYCNDSSNEAKILHIGELIISETNYQEAQIIRYVTNQKLYCIDIHMCEICNTKTA